MVDPVETPTRRTKSKTRKPITVVDEGTFFFEIIKGVVADEGIAGIGSESTINILANTQNAPRWYAAYLCMVRNQEAFYAGENIISLHRVPPAVAAVLKEQNAAACRE